MQNKKGDAKEKIPFFGFVAEGKHAGIDPDASQYCRHKEELAFRNSVSSRCSRLYLIGKHDEKSDDVYREKNYQK